MEYYYTMFLALIMGLSCAAIVLKNNKVPNLHIFLSSFLSFVLIIFFSGMVTFLALIHYDVGFNTSGGAIGLMISVLIFCLLTPENHSSYGKAYVLSLPLMYGIGKIACYNEGCCSGLTLENGSVFPVQLIESITFFALFIVSIIFYLRGKYNYVLAACIYGLTKVGLDFFRYTHETQIISFNQIIGGIVIVLFLIIERILKWKKLKESTEN